MKRTTKLRGEPQPADDRVRPRLWITWRRNVAISGLIRTCDKQIELVRTAWALQFALCHVARKPVACGATTRMEYRIFRSRTRKRESLLSPCGARVRRHARPGVLSYRTRPTCFADSTPRALTIRHGPRPRWVVRPLAGPCGRVTRVPRTIDARGQFVSIQTIVPSVSPRVGR